MGEKQCEVCGHITSGFEDQEFEAQRHAKSELVARLREAVALLELHGAGKQYVPEFKAAIAKAEAR